MGVPALMLPDMSMANAMRLGTRPHISESHSVLQKGTRVPFCIEGVLVTDRALPALAKSAFARTAACRHRLGFQPPPCPPLSWCGPGTALACFCLSDSVYPMDREE